MRIDNFIASQYLDNFLWTATRSLDNGLLFLELFCLKLFFRLHFPGPTSGLLLLNFDWLVCDDKFRVLAWASSFSLYLFWIVIWILFKHRFLTFVFACFCKIRSQHIILLLDFLSRWKRFFYFDRFLRFFICKWRKVRFKVFLIITLRFWCRRLLHFL